MQKFLSNIRPFVLATFANFSRHQGLHNAGSLTYTTLLSLVPLMTVMIAVLSAFPVADKIGEEIQNFVFENFVPTSGELVQQYLGEFSSKASRLSGTGFAFLVLVAVMLMATVDRVINAIWEVKSKRTLTSKLLVYWAILSLGPVLIGASVVVTSYIVSLPILSDAVTTGIGRRLLGLAPVFASTLAFALLYSLIPCAKVRFKHALFGGLVAALLFELAKRAFGLYITAFPTYEAIYGALATIPIFLVWIFLSWVVVLLGAEFTRTLSLYSWSEKACCQQQPNILRAVDILMQLDSVAANGGALSLAQLGEENSSEPIIEQLQKLQYVQQTEQGDWVLRRRIDSLTLYQLYQETGYGLPASVSIESGWAHQLGQLLVAHDVYLAEHLDVSLSILRENTK